MISELIHLSEYMPVVPYLLTVKKESVILKQENRVRK